MPVQFLPVQEPDFPEITRLFLEAFEKDPLLGRLKSDLAEPVRYEETLKYFLQLWGQRHLYGGRFWKAVEVEGDGAEEKTGYDSILISSSDFVLNFQNFFSLRFFPPLCQILDKAKGKVFLSSSFHHLKETNKHH